MRINQNTAAFNANRNLSVTNDQQAKSLEKLSSGFRINRAADDSAGLAISEGLRSQIGGLKQAVRNAQDGISVVQTAEGALTETTSILQRMRDLSVQASSDGSLSTGAKSNIQTEIVQLKSELDRIAGSTTFNGKNLLDGTYTGVFQVGANAGQTINVSVGTAMGSIGLAVNNVDVTTAGAGVAVTQTTASAAGTAGVVTVAAARDFTVSESFEGLNGTISVGGKSLDLSSVTFASGATAAQRTASVQAAVNATFGTGVNALTVGNTATGLTFTQAAAPTAGNLATNTLVGAQSTGASVAITNLDAAISTVSTQRANLGAVQNRLSNTINNLNVATENLSASESRIRDTDMAMEMTNFSKFQILQQAGTAMLAQANQVPQGVLQLLRG